MSRPFRRSHAQRAIVAASLLAALPLVASAQSAIYGAGVQAWLGCWTAGLTSTLRADAPPSIVCIAPTSDVDVAEVLTVQDGRVVAHETLDATGRSRAIDAERCTGSRRATWSRDGRRLFVSSSGTCAGVPSRTSGLLAITPQGEWLDVEGVSAGGATQVHVARYVEVAPPSALPERVRAALRAQSLATRSTRVAAGAPVRAEDLLDAWRAVDSAVVEAWILEGAHRFDVAGADLDALRLAGVPPRIVDALGAAVEPDAYALARADDAALTTPTTMAYDGAYGLPLGWGWGWGIPLVRGARSGGGYRDVWRRGYRPPVVIVRGHDGRPRGRARGRGDDGRGRGRDGGGTAGDGRHPGSTSAPPAGDPRHAPPQQQSGGTVRLGKPRG